MHRLPSIVERQVKNVEPPELGARIVSHVWPDSVERIAAFLRASGTEGRLEEVLSGSESPPGLQVSALAFACEVRSVVGLVPSAHGLDPQKLAAAAQCATLRDAESGPGFPFRGALVFLERSALGVPTVWLELEVPRHFLGLAPSQLLRLTGAQPADLLAEN